MNTDSTPPVESDARQRALRTLAQGFAVDVAAGVGVALAAGLAGGIEWTQAYWVALGLAVTAAVSYIARKLVPPAAAS
jgi:hypothetical protein